MGWWTLETYQARNKLLTSQRECVNADSGSTISVRNASILRKMIRLWGPAEVHKRRAIVTDASGEDARDRCRHRPLSVLPQLAAPEESTL